LEQQELGCGRPAAVKGVQEVKAYTCERNIDVLRPQAAHCTTEAAVGTGECDQQSGLVNQLPQQMVSREADIRNCESTNDVLCRQADAKVNMTKSLV
jgi:hypothetical protein